MPVAEQELAGPLNSVDADLPRLTASFTHDFEKEGLPDKYFRHQGAPANAVRISPGSDGLHVAVEATGAWASIDVLPRFTVSGDFDVEAAFANLVVESRKREAGIILMACMNDPRKSIYGISRILTQEGFQGFQLSTAQAQADGTRSWVAEMTPNAAAAGRLRLARRGDRLHYLFAEEDAQIFRTFHTQPMTDADMERDGLRLHALCSAIGKSDVVWKKLVIRAERMTWYPELPESSTLTLRVMNSDGKVLHADANSLVEDFMWSPDNEQLIVSFDNPDVQGPQLYSVNRKNPGPPQLLPAQPRQCKSHGYCWSRDGKKIAIAGMEVPQPVKWVTGPVAGPAETNGAGSR